MNIETATRRYLLQQPTVTGYVGDKIYKWKMQYPLEGTGQLAIVVRRVGGWAAPDPVMTSKFPVLQIDCYADPDRNEFGEVIENTAGDKASALAEAIEKVCHHRRGEWWGTFGSAQGVYIVSSARWTDARLRSQEDLHRKTEPDLGWLVYVRTEWAVNHL
jgi:hypothetical protein